MHKIYLALLALAILAGCASAHVNPKRINQEAFPAGFNDPKCVLLVQKRTEGLNHKGWNNYLRKSFKKYYKGKFVMASLKEINEDPQYQDKKIYRFIVTDEVWTTRHSVTTTTTTGTSIEYQNATRVGYHLFDRMDDKAYPELGISSNVPLKAMKRTAATLNAKLKTTK